MHVSLRSTKRGAFKYMTETCFAKMVIGQISLLFTQILHQSWKRIINTKMVASGYQTNVVCCPHFISFLFIRRIDFNHIYRIKDFLSFLILIKQYTNHTLETEDAILCYIHPIHLLSLEEAARDVYQMLLYKQRKRRL